jgi:hypothetical protein
MTRIEADSPGLHDDVADALMLATAPFSRDGRSRCRLARFSRLDLPDAHAPDVADTVTTAGGLMLRRAPFWQSVNGLEVSLPPELATPAPPPEPDAIERPRTYLQTTRELMRLMDDDDPPTAQSAPRRRTNTPSPATSSNTWTPAARPIKPVPSGCSKP